MKKRILSILLLCCMVLTMLPTTAFAAGELPDVKLSVPTTFDKTVDLTKQNKELKINMMLGGARNIEQIKKTKLYTDKNFEQ